MFKISGFFQFSLRNYASPNRVKSFRKPIVHKQIEAAAISLRAKGFLRSQKSYEPPKDYYNKIKTICEGLNITDFSIELEPQQKFELLKECSNVFGGHAVPNSQLYEIKNARQVAKFYKKAVDCRTPYEKLDTSIANLHIVPEAKRYNPETDGISAYPKSSTLVTGLKYRKKYQGHIAKTSWP